MIRSRPIIFLKALVLAGWLAPAAPLGAQPEMSSAAVAAAAPAESPMANASGRDLMDAVYGRHQRYPHVYEEQSMVLVDRHGRRETRRLTLYSRLEADGSVRVLLRFTDPSELLGMALLATLYPDGKSKRQVFLPALGRQLISNNSLKGEDFAITDPHFLGTDFSIENLAGENLDHYRYERRRDVLMDQAEYYVVDAFDPGVDRATAAPLRRHFIIKEGLFITRTDHFAANGAVESRHTHHDLVVVNGETWRANMMLMNNLREVHQTIIKVDQRVFSPDYVPDEVFTADWIFANAPAVDEEATEPADDAADAAETLEVDA